MDWAPDFVLREVARLLRDLEMPATWFVTHETPVLDELRAAGGLFELGIHPNFAPMSTHGATPVEVLRHCRALVPEAVSVRAHGLIQSTSLLELYMSGAAPLRVDASTFLTHTPLSRPVEFVWRGRTLQRFVVCWEDDVEFELDVPMWHPATLAAQDAVVVLAFHPIHVYLNSSSIDAYTAVKARYPRLQDAEPEGVHPYVCDGDGARTALEEVAACGKVRAKTLRQLVGDA